MESIHSSRSRRTRLPDNFRARVRKACPQSQVQSFNPLANVLSIRDTKFCNIMSEQEQPPITYEASAYESWQEDLRLYDLDHLSPDEFKALSEDLCGRFGPDAPEVWALDNGLDDLTQLDPQRALPFYQALATSEIPLTRGVAALCLDVLSKFFPEPEPASADEAFPPDPVADLWQQLLQDSDQNTKAAAVEALYSSLVAGTLRTRIRIAINALANLPPPSQSR